MRPVRGFDRPALQWLFVALGIVLVGVAAAASAGLWRARAEAGTLRARELDARIERQRLELQMARERSAREALSLEVSRLRGGRGAADLGRRTLTVIPLTTRGAVPPAPSVDAPPPLEVIELRLVLPRTPDRAVKRYAVELRSWSGGETLWARSNLSAATIDGRGTVTARITGDLLAPGAYEFALTGMTGENKTIEVASYEVAVRTPAR